MTNILNKQLNQIEKTRKIADILLDIIKKDILR